MSVISTLRTEVIGDLLLAFRVGKQATRSRTALGESARLGADEHWTLQSQAAANGWKGVPLRSVSSDDRDVWIVGETFGPADGREPAEKLFENVAAGRQPASDLNGHFLMLCLEKTTGRWHVWTDRFGTFHVYYGTDGHRAAIGTFFPAVAEAASRRRLDWLGLSGFFSFGFFPQDRTYFDDVRILRPASHYVFDKHGQLIQEERYWEWSHQVDVQRSYDETVEEFDRIFGEVIADHTSDGRIAVPVSGGLDSRSTVAALRQTGRNADDLWSYSYGYSKDSVETRIAAQVASVRGLPFDSYVIGPYLFEQLDRVLACLEGFQDVTQARQANLAEEIAQRADYVLAAHWGDVWLDDMGLVNRPSGSMSDGEIASYAMRKMRKRGDAWLLDNLCRPQLSGEDPNAWLQTAVVEELGRVEHIEDLDFRVKAFKTDQWSFRWTTASLRMFRAGAVPRLCFYDTRLADFFCTVPSEFLSGRRLQIDYLKRFAPDLARITWQAYDANLYRYQHFRTWQLPKRAMKKAWHLLKQKKALQRNWEVQFLNDRSRQGLNRWLTRPGLKLHEFAGLDCVCTLLDEFCAEPSDAARGYTVCMLLTFSAWLEQYN